MSNEKKPPLGITSKWIVMEWRMADIKGAIKRYMDANEPIPTEWVAEYNEINSWLKNRRKNA